MFERATRELLNWTRTKVRAKADEINRNRLFLELLICNFRESYSRIPNAARLKKFYLESLKELIEANFECVILSFSVFLLFVEGSWEDFELNMSLRKRI